MTREFVVETDLDLTAVVEFEGIGQKFKPHEEIVRCKDCDHWVWPNTCGREVITRYENDFCSRAERKEVEQCIDRES